MKVDATRRIHLELFHRFIQMTTEADGIAALFHRDADADGVLARDAHDRIGRLRKAARDRRNIAQTKTFVAHR